MKGFWKELSFLLRPLIIIVCISLCLFLLHLLATATLKKRLREIDEGSSFDGVSYGFYSILIENLRMPDVGLSAEETYIIIEGDLLHPSVSSVVFNRVDVHRSTSETSTSSSSISSAVMPPISIINGSIPLYGTEFFGRRADGIDMGSASGSWGSVFLYHSCDSISVVFNNCSSIPGAEDLVPDLARGHSISGNCSGILEPVTSISGYITELDGHPASASFDYCLQEDQPSISLAMDFSQVAEPAMTILDSLSSGAIMTAAPSGSLSVIFPGNDSVFFSTNLVFDSLSIFSEAVAPDTFFTDVGFSCTGFVLPDSGFVVVDSGFISFHDLTLSFNLNYSWDRRRKLNLFISNRSLSGASIIESIPPELLGSLRGLDLGGELSVAAELLLDWDYPDSCDINLDIDASRLTVGYSPITFGRLRDQTGADCRMRDSWGNSSIIGLDTLTNPEFVFFDSLPACFEPLLRCAEDASFRRHHGFSEYHIRNSIRANMERGRFVRGGSTLSMQLAKNLFLGREKTLSRKLQEVFLTWRLERWLSKERILEIYANIVELGPGVFGFNSAAMYYFNEEVSDLSVKEMAYLVSILPGPKLYHRYAVRGVLPDYWDSYVERLITICGNRGWLPESVVSGALADTLIFDGDVSLF